jgi:ABC-type Mn2+/Zn2+ transport system ATPase subunit
MLVQLENTTFGYGRRAVVHVDHVELSPGECLGVYGPNGSGKTTLVRGLTGLLRPMSGDVTHTPGLRGGYLPQRRDLQAHWPMTGFDAAALAVSTRRFCGWLGAGAKQVVRASMAKLNVEDLAKRPFATLSGGQQQRLMLAGALAAGSDLLVLDEPTDGLDATSRLSFIEAVKQSLGAGLAAVLVSHDPDDLAALSTRVARVQPSPDGRRPSTVQCVATADLWPAARPDTAGAAR